MSGLESLKSLTVKSPSIWGPSNRVPWTDVCMVLATVSTDASRYGRLKYSMEYSQRPHVLRNLLSCALKIKWNKSLTNKEIYSIYIDGKLMCHATEDMFAYIDFHNLEEI